MLSYILPIAVLALQSYADKSSTTSTPPTTAINTQTLTFFDPYQSADFGYLPVYTSGYTLSNYEASIKDANPCASTFDLAFAAPGIQQQTFHIVDGISTFDRAFSLSTGIFQATLTQSCTKEAKDGTTQAICTQSQSVSASGASAYSTVITTTFTNYNAKPEFQEATITAGGNFLTAASGTCTKNGNAAAPTVLADDFYKIIVVPAAAILAVAVI